MSRKAKEIRVTRKKQQQRNWLFLSSYAWAGKGREGKDRGIGEHQTPPVQPHREAGAKRETKSQFVDERSFRVKRVEKLESVWI